MLSSILIALLVVAVLILAHEIGHFLVAKWSGIWVEEFGLFLPPRLLAKKLGETIYSLNMIPLGGFVRLHGETSGEPLSHPKRAFVKQKKSKRAGVALAGIIANFVLAILAGILELIPYFGPALAAVPAGKVRGYFHLRLLVDLS